MTDLIAASNELEQEDVLVERQSRRGFVRNTSKLSLTGFLLLSGCAAPSSAQKKASPQSTASDVRVLNTAINAEREAVAAYQLGAESGLLSAGVLDVAVKFQGHHKAHTDALIAAVRKLGGQPDEPGVFSFPVEKLKTERDVLEFAASLERGAVSAYVGAIPVFKDRTLSGAAASILADEAMHWATLRSALGLDPVPEAFFQ